MLSIVATSLLAACAFPGVHSGSYFPFGASNFAYQNQAPSPSPPNQGSGSVPNAAALVQGGSRLPPSGPQNLVPVYLTSEVAKPTSYPPLKISVNKNAKLISRNDGFFVFSVPAGPGKVATLTGGPAKNTYEFGLLAQNVVYDTPNARASTMEDDKGFPAQVQVFFVNSAYYNFSNAINYQDGIIIFPFNIVVQGTQPNQLAQPYVNLLQQLKQPNSTSSIGACDALEWLLTSLEPGFYVHASSYIDITTFKEFPCATNIQPSFNKHPYVSKPQYKAFTDIVNRNSQPEINPLPLFLLAGRDVFQGNSPASYDCYCG